MSKPWNKLIVALDLTSEKKIKELIGTLSPKAKKFKVGLIAYTKFGPEVLKWVKRKRCDVFLDFKLYDIPNTMLEVAKAFVDLGVWAFTVHLKAGGESLQFLKAELGKYARSKKKRRPLIIGVTELTSSKASLAGVLALAKTASVSGIDGVVCSVWESKKIKAKFGLKTITPGIRKNDLKDDQKRIATVSDALRERSDYFVVGRPIIRQKNPYLAAKEVLSS